MNDLFESSVVINQGTLSDNRCLQLLIEFYEFNEDMLLCLSNDLLNWLDDLLHDSFISFYYFDRQSVKDIDLKDRISTAISTKNLITISFESFFCSQIVNSKTAAKKWRNEISRSMLPFHFGVSMDFKPYWHALFPDRTYEKDEVKEKIHTLFSETGKKYISTCALSDIQGFLHINRYQNNLAQFYGSFCIGVNTSCLDTNLERAAERFTSKIVHLSETYHQMNARVMLQPLSAPIGESPYMSYFGLYCNHDGSHLDAGQTPKEWYTTYYLRGVEWANIISPRAKNHIIHAFKDGFDSCEVQCYDLIGGGTLLKSEKPIFSYDVADALALKEIVKDALYPGGTAISVKRMLSAIDNMQEGLLPRHDWAIVPIFPDEIKIIGENLVFQSLSF